MSRNKDLYETTIYTDQYLIDKVFMVLDEDQRCGVYKIVKEEVVTFGYIGFGRKIHVILETNNFQRAEEAFKTLTRRAKDRR